MGTRPVSGAGGGRGQVLGRAHTAKGPHTHGLFSGSSRLLPEDRGRPRWLRALSSACQAPGERRVVLAAGGPAGAELRSLVCSCESGGRAPPWGSVTVPVSLVCLSQQWPGPVDCVFAAKFPFREEEAGSRPEGCGVGAEVLPAPLGLCLLGWWWAGSDRLPAGAAAAKPVGHQSSSPLPLSYRCRGVWGVAPTPL